MVIVRLIDGTERVWQKIEKPPPRKLTFQERNPKYNPNVNYKDEHLAFLSERPGYVPVWAIAQVKRCGFTSYSDMIHSMYYGTEASVKKNETAYMYYEDDTRAVSSRKQKSATQKAMETFGLAEPKKATNYPDKWFITFNWAPTAHNEKKRDKTFVEMATAGVQRLFMKDWVLEARGCFEYHGKKKNHPHFMCVLKIDQSVRTIETLGKFHKVIKEASLASWITQKNFIEFLAFEERHDEYVDLIKCDAKLDALDRDRIWRDKLGLLEQYNKKDYMKDY